MKTKEEKQQNKYGANQMIKIVAIIMLVYLLLHIRPLKDPYGNRFIAFNMDNFCGFFSSSGEGFVIFPHTMETELGSITMKPFCWVRYTDGFQRGINNDYFTSHLYFNNQELKDIEQIMFLRIHDPENSDKRKIELQTIDGSVDTCIFFPYSGFPVFIGRNEIRISQICNTSYKESDEFNNILLNLVVDKRPYGKDILKFDNNIHVTFQEAAMLFIPAKELWQLLTKKNIFLVEGLTKEPLECTKIYFEPDWGAVKKVVTPEGEELVF